MWIIFFLFYHKSQIAEVIEIMGCHFDLKILEKTRKLLDIEFEETDGYLLVHYQLYVYERCEKFRKYNFPISSLSTCKGVIFLKVPLPASGCWNEEMSNYPYKSSLGC